MAVIADNTLKAVRKEFDGLQYDESVIKAIGFLANIIVSSRQDDQVAFLQQNGYKVESDFSLFALTACVQDLIQTEKGSLETNKLARDSAVQAVMEYYQQDTNP